MLVGFVDVVNDEICDVVVMPGVRLHAFPVLLLKEACALAKNLSEQLNLALSKLCWFSLEISQLLHLHLLAHDVYFYTSLFFFISSLS